MINAYVFWDSNFEQGLNSLSIYLQCKDCIAGKSCGEFNLVLSNGATKFDFLINIEMWSWPEIA